MTSLELVGALGAFKTFPDTLSANNVARLHVTSESARAFVAANISALREQSLRPDLQDAWAKALKPPSLARRAGSKVRRKVSACRK